MRTAANGLTTELVTRSSSVAEIPGSVIMPVAFEFDRDLMIVMANAPTIIV